MNSLMTVYDIHTCLVEEKCVDNYTIKVDNKSEDVTVDVRFFDCNKRFVLKGGRDDAHHNRCIKKIKKLLNMVEQKNGQLEEEHG